METNHLCQRLQWDSDILRCNIARVTQTLLSANEMGMVMNWCDAHSIDCLYFLTESNEPDIVKLVGTNGFHLVDVRITFERGLNDIGDRQRNRLIRLSSFDDIPFLKAIAKVSYRNARFYYEPHFSQTLCDEMHEIWIENSCNGYADAVLVSESQGQPVSYVTCHLKDRATGQIGLIGVSPNAKGQGLGKRMVNAALHWFMEQGVQNVVVVTQARNITAQRLYQTCGFRTESAHLWYHRWFSRES